MAVIDLDSGKILDQMSLKNGQYFCYLKDGFLYGFEEDENEELFLGKYQIAD